MHVSRPLLTYLQPSPMFCRHHLLADNDTVLQTLPGEPDISRTVPDRSNKARSVGITEDAASTSAGNNTSSVGRNTAAETAKAAANLDTATVGRNVGLNSGVGLVVSENNSDVASLAGVNLASELWDGLSNWVSNGSCSCDGSKESGDDESDLHFDGVES